MQVEETRGGITTRKNIARPVLEMKSGYGQTRTTPGTLGLAFCSQLPKQCFAEKRPTIPTIMSARNLSFRPGSRSLPRIIASTTMLSVMLIISTPARAAFHLWSVREIYSDASGTNQFIEFYTPFGNQQ